MAKGKCNLQLNTDVSLFFSAIEILTDFSLSLLPAVLLWDVQMVSVHDNRRRHICSRNSTDSEPERKIESIRCCHACTCLIVSIPVLITGSFSMLTSTSALRVQPLSVSSSLRSTAIQTSSSTALAKLASGLSSKKASASLPVLCPRSVLYSTSVSRSRRARQIPPHPATHTNPLLTASNHHRAQPSSWIRSRYLGITTSITMIVIVRRTLSRRRSTR
jgi:hypothetical protein